MNECTFMCTVHMNVPTFSLRESGPKSYRGSARILPTLMSSASCSSLVHPAACCHLHCSSPAEQGLLGSANQAAQATIPCMRPAQHVRIFLKVRCIPAEGAVDALCKFLGHEEGSPCQRVLRGRWICHCSDSPRLLLAADRV